MCRKCSSLTLFRMGLFVATHGWGAQPPLHKICHTNPTVMKFGTVIPYPMKIQKIYKSHDTFILVLLTSAFFLRKSAIFVISSNSDTDRILIHNF